MWKPLQEGKKFFSSIFQSFKFVKFWLIWNFEKYLKKFFFSFLKRFSHYFIPFLGSCRNLEQNIPYSSHKVTLKSMYVCNKLELENLKTVLMAFGCVFLNCDIFLNNGQIKKKKGISLTYGPRAIRQHRFWYKIMIFFFVCSSW